MGVATTSVPLRESIQSIQLRLLRSFFEETGMNSTLSRPLHNWFLPELSPKPLGYCNFTGVSCNAEKFVVALDLNGTGLAGSIPISVSKFEKLHRLHLKQNNLIGNIPTSIGDLKNLRQLELGKNFFNGKIPTELGALSLLQRLKLQENKLEGTIPNQICTLTNLVSLDISRNPNIMGTLPSCLGNLVEMTSFRIRDNALTGTVPIQLCDGQSVEGLIPNAYGCDGVACPVGTFQRDAGRHTNRQACVRCPILSNVIGSTSCRYVERHHTLAPTEGYESKSPSTLVLSATPSRAPNVSSAFPSMAPLEQETPTHDPTIIELPETTDDIVIVRSPSWAPSSNRLYFDQIPNGEDSERKSHGLKPAGIVGIIIEILVVVALLVLILKWRHRGARPMDQINILTQTSISLGDETQITTGESVRGEIHSNSVTRISVQSSASAQNDVELQTTPLSTIETNVEMPSATQAHGVSPTAHETPSRLHSKARKSVLSSVHRNALKSPVVQPLQTHPYAANLFPSTNSSTQSAQSVSSFSSSESLPTVGSQDGPISSNLLMRGTRQSQDDSPLSTSSSVDTPMSRHYVARRDAIDVFGPLVDSSTHHPESTSPSPAIYIPTDDDGNLVSSSCDTEDADNTTSGQGFVAASHVLFSRRNRWLPLRSKNDNEEWRT